jgi:D-hydroxyproline dehydrogenase subunit gamma
MRRLDDAGAVVRFTFDGREVEAREGDSVAAALVAAGIGPVRFSALSGEPRAPYCMMGVCFECLVEIDGLSNRQACMVKVRPGMQVSPGRAPDA